MGTQQTRFTSQSEINAQYDAGAAVPDYPAFLARWQSDSAAVREGWPCHLGVPYGPTLAEKLDIFPAAAAAAPVHVFFHGGYWRSLAAADFSFVATGLRNLGFTTVVVDYALCPSVRIGEIVRQARACIAWVARNIGGFGGDPGRISVSGHSAGGHLAMAAMLAPWRESYGLGDDTLKAALSISGLHDLAPLRYSYLQPVLQLDEQTVARYSPIHLAKRVSARVRVTWGELESPEFGRQATEFATALTAAGIPVECAALPGAHHFSVLDGYLDPQSELCTWLARTAR